MPATEGTDSVVLVTARSAKALPVTAPSSTVPTAPTAIAGPGVRVSVSTLCPGRCTSVPSPTSHRSWSVSVSDTG